MQTLVRYTRAVTAIALLMVVSACSGTSTGTRTTPQASTQSKAVKPSSCASPSNGSCSAVIDLSDNRFDEHIVPLSPNALSDATADVPLDIHRHWSFTAHNHGAGTVGSASISAGSSRTFSTTPPPPFTASGGPLGPDTEIRTPGNLERAFVVDSAAPAYTSSRAFDTVVVPAGGGTQQMTGTFTLDSDASQVQILLDSNLAGATWTYAGCAPSCNTSVLQATGPQVQVFVNNPVVGTTYTLTFTGVIPNASPQPISYKPRLLFLRVHNVGTPPNFASSYSMNDAILAGTVTYTFDAMYELHAGMSDGFGIDYQGGSGPAPIVGSFPSNGAFVIGDRSAVLGSHVTFWGARWASQNALSGGRAPSAFKGFEGGSQPTACTGHFSAEPGGSGDPPRTIPNLMMVLVTSHVSRSEEELTGDVVHIVVVKTDPGYAPEPGFPGTGTVVGQIC